MKISWGINSILYEKQVFEFLFNTRLTQNSHLTLSSLFPQKTYLIAEYQNKKGTN